MENLPSKHNTYVINLENRIDRKINIEEEFSKHTEYEVRLFKAIPNKRGSLGLFLSIQEIIKLAVEEKREYVIICQDDHVFTASYNKVFFDNQLKIGKKLGFDILLGGMSNVHDALFFTSDLLWVGGFSGLQFAVVFSKFYDTILSYKLGRNPFDLALGEISDQIYCCYPAISSQYSYGYSDATLKNNYMDVDTYFKTCNKKLERLYKVSKYFDIIEN